MNLAIAREALIQFETVDLFQHCFVHANGEVTYALNMKPKNPETSATYEPPQSA